MHASRTTRILLLAILLIALGLRFYRLDLAEYKLDEANLSRLALEMARSQRIPLQSIGSSFGPPNGPLSAWLLAIPYIFSRSPIVATGFVAMLNVIAVAMTFALARQMFGLRTGLIAALLFAVAPWAVLNSRKLWAQDLLPPFTIAYLWTAYLAFIKNKPWMLAAHIFALSACIQLHYSALTFAPLTLIWLFTFRRRWQLHVIAIALLAGLVSIAPFAYQLVRDGASILAFMTKLNRQPKVDTDALYMAWLMTTGTNLHSLAGPQEFRNFLAGTSDLSALFHLEGVLVIAGLLLAIRQVACIASRRRQEISNGMAASGYVVATAFLLPVLLFTVHITPIYPHYFILTFPSQFILAGMFMGRDDIFRRHSRTLDWLMSMLAAVIAAAQIYGYLSILNFVGTRYTPDGYGTPVGLTLRAVRSAEQMARELNGAVMVMADGDNTEADEIASIWSVLVDPALAPRIVDRRQSTVYPAEPTVIVRAPGAAGTQGDFNVPLRSNEGEYSLVRWMGGTPPVTSGLTFTAPASWANGVQLLAAQALGELRPGGTLRWQLTWRINSPAPRGVDYHWTNQLFDAEGRRVWQKDDVGFPAHSWRAGDVVTTDFTAPLAADVKPGFYLMRVGLYTYPDIKTVPTTQGAAYIEIAPIEIK